MKIIGHRGSAGTHLENTLPAFRAAWSSTADGVEGDVRLTADRQLVLLHDPTLARTFNSEQTASASTFEQLQAATQKHSEGPVPSLAQLLAEAPTERWLFVEIKTDAADDTATPERYLAALNQAFDQGRMPLHFVRLISFDPFLLLRLKQLAPHFRSLWLPLPQLDAEAIEAFWTDCRLSQLDGIGHSKTLGTLPSDFAGQLRDAGKELSVWTVYDLETACTFQQAAYDFLTTDFPADFASELR
ncbi:MAG: glycerophosphodiester phosphodiesterase [Opitutales bacterium]